MSIYLGMLTYRSLSTTYIPLHNSLLVKIRLPKFQACRLLMTSWAITFSQQMFNYEIAETNFLSIWKATIKIFNFAIKSITGISSFPR